MPRAPLLTFVLFLLAGTGRTQTPLTSPDTHSPLSGTWTGNIIGVKLVFHFSSAPSGKLEGTMDSPQQGATGFPIQDIFIQKDSFTLLMQIPAIRYTAARIDESTLVGTWYQSGRSFPLTIHRLDDSAARAYTPPPRPQTPRPPYPYHSDSVEYDNMDKTVHLGATLTWPDKGGPFPAAILITGSGIQDRDETLFGHKPFAVIADYLTRHGYAVLRVDDRSAGLSTGDIASATSADFSRDVETSLAWLRTRKEIDPKKIGLIGHSEGAMIAPMLAARRKDIAFIISLAGPVDGYATLMYQTLKPLQDAHVGNQLIAYSLTKEKILLDNIKSATDSTSFMNGVDSGYRSYYAAIPDSVRPQYAFAVPPQTLATALAPMARTLASPWWKFLVNYKADTYYRNVRCPVLLMGGEKDVQVPNAVDMETIASMLKDQKNKQVEIHLLPGLNHLFQHCHTCTVPEYAQLQETFSTEALAIMGDWLDKIFKPNSSPH
jgi:pimeloyl-ACP methyl ester carboxylesterase